jgi:predicted dehydrogenase
MVLDDWSLAVLVSKPTGLASLNLVVEERMRVQDSSMSAAEHNGHGHRIQLRPIRIGVIGVGNMGQHHARVLSSMKDVELVGVADINVERGLETASKYKVRFFEDYCDLLPHVEAVCIAVPTRLHYAVGITCLLAGIHVLIEKPIAASISEAESLVNAAAESGCILQVGHIERFSPAFQELSKVLKTEEVLALEAHRMSPYSNRANDVSVVLDLMIHDIDLLLELAASPVVKLTASGNRTLDSGYLDYVTATLGFANGIVATLTASKVTHRKIRTIVAHCKNSYTEADFLKNEILIHRHITNNSIGDYRQVLYKQDGVIERVYTSNTDKLGAELEHFVNCVRGGNQPSVGGEQALKALRLASLVEQMVLEDKVWNPLDWESETKVQSLTPTV